MRVFGGGRTKLLVGKAVGNLIAGRAEDDEFVRPHTLLLRNSSLPVPLSVYLRGHDAIAAIAGNKWLQYLELVITYGGEDEFEGLKCQKVVVTTVLPGSDDPQLTTSELWLAERRNYLPIRVFLWDLKRSAEIPRVDGFVSELRELKPGIWFPVSAQVTSYEPFTLQSEGKQQLGLREEYFVESASLEPQYDLAYFSDLEFPDGTAVYEVENGEIKKGYRVVAPEAPDGPPAAGFRLWWLLWGILAMVGLIAAAVVWRRRRALKSAAGGPGGAVA